MYKLKGKLQQYAWGGNEFLPQLLGMQNTDRKPFAEYWMGAHPSASATLETEGGMVSLQEVIKNDPAKNLSQKVYDRFGELPYLFKVLDVNRILSIQVHPSKEEAEKGFAYEESIGIPPDAFNRNYKDRNHKPEMMVALSDFWLLHGFKSWTDIEKTLEDVPEFNILLPFFRREGLKALYRFVMEMEQGDINRMLTNLIKREIRRKHDNELTKAMPGWWIAKMFEGKKETADIDRAVFSVYFFNIVTIHPGDGIFQGAGLPHAYMEGQCIELMANSDNVLRAGLTAKHIDVPELMKHVLFESVTPVIMHGTAVLPGEKVFVCPVPDFRLAKIDLTASLSYSGTASSIEIFFISEGGAVINNSLVVKKGEAFAVMAAESYTIHASGHCSIFKAFVPEI